MNRNQILAVGSVALDTVKTPFGSIQEGLGGSATFFSLAARFFAPVAVSAVVGSDFPKEHFNLFEKLGVNTRDLHVAPGRTFRWKGIYDYDLNSARTLKTELNVFQKFNPKISIENRNSPFVFLANIDPELQQSVLRQVFSPKIVACDTMNYWIEHKRKSLLKLLRQVDIFLCNDSEARELTHETNFIKAARWISQRGPKLFVIKKGEHGVLCFFQGEIFSCPAYPLETVFDPTGAGDSFAGGFIGYLTQFAKPSYAAIRKAIIYGSVVASYNVESFSLKRLVTLTRPEIEKRYNEFKKITSF